MKRAYKYRIYPIKEQQRYFARCFGCCRKKPDSENCQKQELKIEIFFASQKYIENVIKTFKKDLIESYHVTLL